MYARRTLALAIMVGLGSADVASTQDRPQTDQPNSVKKPAAQPVEATSLFGQPLRRMTLSGERLEKMQKQLQQAQSDFERDPSDIDNIVWLGRRLAYLWRYKDAIQVYTDGIAKHPEDPHLYRHRGHRYITIRKFELAVSDLEKAAKLIAGKPDEIEPDGQPNSAGIPTSTLHTNIWYHLGLAYYLQAEYHKALAAYERCLAASKNNDMRVATMDWMYMTLRRIGLHEEAKKLAGKIKPDWEILENHAYHRRLLMYGGQLEPDALLNLESSDDRQLDIATYGYGIGNWHLAEGRKEQAVKTLRRVLKGPYWAAFGYIAAEADLKRTGQSPVDDTKPNDK